MRPEARLLPLLLCAALAGSGCDRAGDPGNPGEPGDADETVATEPAPGPDPETGPEAGPPNLLLVTIDTLRADRLGSYGDPHAITPAMDALAAGGVRFDRAISQASWTLPSMATIHTGLYPSQHGATRIARKVADVHTTLAEVLARRGYHNAAAVSHLLVNADRGFAQGFDAFDESQVANAARTSSPGLTHVALDLVRDAPEPWFLWVHYFDPHDPYHPHPRFGIAGDYAGELEAPLLLKSLIQLGRRTEGHVPADDLTFARALYAEEIAFTDAAVGELLEGLRARDTGRPLVVALTADHGEGFFEHGRFGHGTHVYQEVVRVPLILSGDLDPSLRGVVVGEPVELASLARTLAGLAGIAEPPLGGRDLLALAREGDAEASALSEGGSAWSGDPHQMALVGPRWKLIHRLDPDGEGFELYDLPADPGEQRDLWEAADPELAGVKARLSSRAHRLRRFLRAAHPDPDVEVVLEPDEERLLRSLGYVE